MMPLETYEDFGEEYEVNTAPESGDGDDEENPEDLGEDG